MNWHHNRSTSHVNINLCLLKLFAISEIRLKEYGRELVEVIDNGSGVEESNIEGLSEFLPSFDLHS